MSYASRVKEELCKINNLYSHCKITLLEALLCLNGEVKNIEDSKIIIFKSSNLAVSKLFSNLIREFYNCEVIYKEETLKYLKQAITYIVEITTQTETIIEEFLIQNNSTSKEEIEANECCIASYLRGAFLARGSVNDPNTSEYHLEIAVTKESEAISIQKLMNNFDLNAKITRRRNKLIIYLKDIQMIKDFLRIIGAIKTVFELEEVIIQRSFNTDITRVINCEIANETKTINAAKDQLKYIRYLEYNYPLEKLDSKILMVMKVRKENPEASFNELLEIIKSYGEHLTKSGLNHRFRKIKELVMNHQTSKQKE